MISRVILVWFLLASLSGWFVYRLKYEVQHREVELAHLNRAIIEEEKTAHILKAEWAYLTEPARIAARAVKFLPLVPVIPTHLIEWSQVPTIDDHPGPQGFEPRSKTLLNESGMKPASSQNLDDEAGDTPRDDQGRAAAISSEDQASPAPPASAIP